MAAAALPSSMANSSSALIVAASSALPSPTASVPVDAASLSTFGLLGRVILAVLRVLPGLLYWIITFTTITLPTWLFTLFSMSLTFTMNFTTLLLIVVFLVSTVSYLVRYRYMTLYTRLPPDPQRDEPQVEVFPDTQEGDSKRGLSNYLDEFLSAIKVFGYLERPVFHELTRTMQTRRLIAGETLLLEEEKGFCLVVDGHVQIFVKSNRDGPGSDDEGRSSTSPSEDGAESGHSQGYQLLTEVKNGAPMSSLFSILSLFTEDVKLRHEEEEDIALDSSASSTVPDNGRQGRPPAMESASFHMDESRPQTPDQVPDTSSRFGLRERRASNFASPTAGGRLSSVPPLSLDLNGLTNQAQKAAAARKSRSKSARPKSAHPDIVARATVDTTIAIIPATAFRRLTRVYPKATAQIVQVILTRLQRVTLATGHAYLGLTSEVLRTERLMNKYTTYDLPDYLRDSALERLKEKFAKERERIGPEEGMKGIALHNPRAKQGRRSSTSLRKGAAAHARLAAARGTSFDITSETRTRLTSPESRDERVSAGDLLTNTHIPRGSGRQARYSFSQPYQENRRETKTPLELGAFNPFSSPLRRPVPLSRQASSMDEDSVFREAVLDCMFKAIGLSNMENTTKPVSVDQSPRMVSFDAKRQKALFTNAFGFIDPYDTSRDGDSESIVSASGMSSLSVTNHQNMLEEIVNDVEIVFFPKDAVLVEQGERNPGLYYVIDGFLDVSVPIEEDNPPDNVLGTLPTQASVNEADLFARPGTKRNNASFRTTEGAKKKKSRKSLFLTKPGGLAGYLGTVSSYRSFVDVTAKTDVYVGFLPRASIERIVDRYPVVLLTMAKRLTTLLPRLILHIDFALEWVQVNAGQIVFNQGDESDAIYIVLNGRLRAIQDGENNNMKVIGEYGQGDSVGELEVLTESVRPGSLHAIRDAELAKFPKTLFNSLALEHPGITIKISKIIASRMRALIDDPLHEQTRERSSKATRNNVSSIVNLRTVAILPVTAGIPVVEFASRLMNALNQIGTPGGVVSLNQAAILNHLGRHAFNRMGKLKVSQYLADLEEKYGLVLYVADTTVKSPWTQTCISQADCILLVGLAEGSPNIGEYERFLLTTKTTARKELVLLHTERYCSPGLTRTWLNSRPWVNGSHHHVHMSFRTTSEPVHPAARRFGNALKHRVQVLQAEIQKYTSRRVRQTPLYSADTPFKGDFHRLARRLCGKSVGLVLGGGGARGIAHIGIIRAMEEAGIPIDIVGGTSIGAFIGALYAWDADVVPMYGRAKKFAGRMGSMWRFALDLTYPSASYTTGHEFNRGIFKTFGNSQMEDFWLEFYCNTTNISKSRSEIHTRGYVWRYVRASMSLAGLLPPLCDNGNMLLDGGYIDNLTVTHMKSLGADVIFAVDVGSLDDDQPQAFGDSLSGFWALVNRWNPFSSYPNPPTLSEIQSRLAYVSSYDALERAKNTPGCRFMRPPIDAYGTLEFAKFDEIYQVGYKYGKEYLAELREQGVLPVTEETEKEKDLRRTMAPRRASI